VTNGEQIGESLFQLNSYEAEGLVKDGKLSLNINVAADNNISWLSFKNVKYTKVRDLTEDEKINWADEFAAAQTRASEALNNQDFINVTGAERTQLTDACNVDGLSTDEDYQNAINAIDDAIQTFKDAKSNYDLLAAEKAYAQSLGMADDAINEYDATASTTATTVLTNVQDLKVAEYTYINETYANTVTLGDWTENFAEDLNNEGYLENGATYFNEWNGSAQTRYAKQTINLPAGEYAISVIARGQQGNSGYLYATIGENQKKADLIIKGNRGRGVNTSGVATFADDQTYTCNNEGFGWEYRYLTFTLSEATDVEVGVEMSLKAGSWISVYAPVLLTSDVAVKNQLLDEIATALDNIPTGYMSIEAQSELDAACTNAENASDEYTVDVLNNILTTLNDAIQNANTSIANYVAAKTYLDKASTLDEAGQASYNDNETVAAVKSAYDDATLEALTAEQITALDEAIITAAKAQTTAGSDWTLALVNPSFENGFSSGWTNTGMAIQNNTSFEKDGNNYCEKWQPNGTFSVKQTITLPAGVYAISAKAKARGVTSAKIFANGIETAVTVQDATDTYTVQFACDDNAEVEFGFEGVGTGAGSSWLCVDDFHMTLVSAGLPDVTAVTGKMNAEVAAAQTTAINTYNAEKTVANYNAAVAAIAAAEASIAAYAKVPQAIADANALKDAHNFVTVAAATAFDEAITAAQSGYDNGTLTDAEANNYANLGVRAVNWHNVRAEADYTSAEAYMKSAGFNVEFNDWSVEGANDGTDFLVPFFQNWTSDANSLGNTTITATLTDMPNGLYSVEAWVRVRAKNETAATDATGITMDVNGGGEGDYAAVDVTEGEQIGEGQFQIGTYTAQGLVKQGTLTLNFNIVDANISWLSFKNVKYTKERDLTPEEEFVAATDEDYAFLNGNLAKYALGFEAGEFAPYNNSALVQAIAAAKAIDQTAVNSKEDVQAAAEAITSAGGIANETEVNAIYDGAFAAAENDGAPAGWVTTHSSGLGGSLHARTFVLTSGMNNYDNLEAFGQGDGTRSAFFLRFDGTHSAQGTWYNYGGTSGYTMPLKANTNYKVTLQAGAWGNYANKNLAVTVKDANGERVLSETITTTKKTSNGEGVDDGSFIFTTNEAGDYTFSLWNGNGSNNYAAIVSNIVLVKATAADLKEALLAEITTASAVDLTANVGEGVFQKPASAATALTTAISDAQEVYDNTDATVDQVIAATESVKTAVETYNNVEINEPADGQLFNVVLTYSGYTYDQKAMTYIANGRTDAGNYNIQYKEAANVNLAQAFTFTKVDGNNYVMSQIDADGNVRYISTGVPYGGNTGQIRTTTTVDKALKVTVIPTATEGVWNLKNTEANQYIGSQDAGVYTVNSHIDFNIVETSKPSIAINTMAAGWGTTILPFAVASLPEGVKAYTCGDAVNGVLTLDEVTALEANKPYIIEGTWNETLTGDAQGVALNYTVGLLTGTYEDIDAPDGKYIMQKQNDKVGFYHVDYNYLAQEGMDKPKVKANRVYLTAPESASGARAFFFDGGETTGINAIEALANGDAQIFNVNGVQQPRLMKGLNIIVTNDGKTHKVMVK
jgi:hypothetical protein